MNKDRILLKLVLDEIGLEDLEIGDFRSRKILQKKMYLLQLTGVNLGYRYNWYLYGPYCPALANDTFTLRDEKKYDTEFTNYELNSRTKNKLHIIDSVISLPENPQTNEHEWLELLASLHYLRHIAYWPGKDDPQFEEVFKKLKESKPHFQDKKTLAEAAWEKLDKAGLVRRKTLE
ncbi:MAG: hypothetical protein JW720_00365 [Sedimentisphaerales bacterium]|nr:hypothetical protein [Sedimentisphaerales bacterium]